MVIWVGEAFVVIFDILKTFWSFLILFSNSWSFLKFSLPKTQPAELSTRVELFFSVPNRSVEVYALMSEAHPTLNSIVFGLPRTTTLLANYTFFKKEFDWFIYVSSERAEVPAVLSELCVSLERFWKQTQDNSTTRAERK